MFAYIQGKLVHKEATLAVIDANGIGYEIRIATNTAGALLLDQVCRLYIYLHIKEDAHTLYGFLDYETKKLFMQLISVSGVGTNTAMLILSSLSNVEVREAILKEDIATLKGVKGIGIKTAQQIILDLKDKLKKEDLQESSISPNKLVGFYKTYSGKQEALEALMTLGIAKNVAEKSIENVLKKYGTDLKTEEIIRYALKNN
jgi:Holliday junction DNA helicase RuvA